IFVLTDAGQAVIESDEGNNAAGSATIALTVPPLPDLRVSNVQPSASTGEPGQSLTVTWTATNAGTAEATGNWVDRLYLSSDGTFNGATLLASVANAGSLAAGASRSVSVTVTLPRLADGDYTLLVLTDADGVVYEGANEGNNSATSAGTFALRHADLV